MNSLDTLLFPDTEIFKEKLYPLLLLCRPLRFLQPVEAGPGKRGQEDTDLFMERGLCQALTPTPLGPDRERFLRLLDDIRNRRDDYAAQLSSLIVAGMSAPAVEKSAEARHQIVSSLLKEKNVVVSEPGTADLELWQARLVLAIAEMLEEEEEELYQNLQLLDEREMQMYRELQGSDQTDEDNPFAELEQIKERLENARPRELKMRFKAWLKLMRSSPVSPPALWLASSQDSADQVFTGYEKQSDVVAPPVLKLPLPLKIQVSPIHLVKQIDDFRRDAQDAMQSIIEDIDRLSTASYHSPAGIEELLPAGNDAIGRWESLIDDHFPTHIHGRTDLVFYLLPECRIEHLLDIPAIPDDNRINGILAVLRG